MKHISTPARRALLWPAILAICALWVSPQRASAQCTNFPYGLYPSSTFVPVCNGSNQTITTIGWAGEYSNVDVISGTTYTFSSSVSSDVITITNSAGTTALTTGVGSKVWTATLTGTVRFATHLAGSATSGTSRTRSVACGSNTAPNPCLSVTAIQCGATTTTTLTGSPSAFSSNACGFATPGQEKVYSFTAPSAGVYTLTVAGTGSPTDYFDYAWSTSCNPTGWNCIDDLSNSLGGSVTFTLPAAGTYYLLLDKENFSTSSTVTHSWTLTCPAPAPANDGCANAATLACGQTVSGSTLSATPDAAPSCLSAPGTAGGVWYKVTGTGAYLQATTCGAGTNFDTQLHVYTGSCAALTCVTSNDDYSSTPYTCSSSSLRSIVEWCSNPGQTYYILLSGYNAASGSYDLSLSCAAANVTLDPVSNLCLSASNVTLVGTPAGGSFAGPGVSGNVFSPSAAGPGTHTLSYSYCGGSASTTVTVFATPANDNCVGAIGIVAGGSYSGNTTCATTDALNYCGTTGGSAPGVWYTFTGDGQRYTITTCNGGTDYDTKLNVFRGSCSGLTCITGNDDIGSSICTTGPGNAGFKSAVEFCTTIGETYYVYVHGFSSNVGNYQIDVTATAGPSGTVTASTYACGYNVSCAGAANGSATVNAGGGAGGYSYLWSNGQTTATATGLAAGNYTVTITDANGCQGTAAVTLSQPAALTANAGANTTVIFGYPSPNNCATLTASGSGGCGPYTYAWSNGGSTASINVCPSVTTDYTVTVTDANGCSATDQVRVCVNNVVCGRAGNHAKISICHVPPGNPNNGQTLCISETAVSTHLGHGDYLGACGSNNTLCLDGSLSNQVSKSAASPDGMGISAFPNPFAGNTTVEFSTAGDEQVMVRAYNVLGEEMGLLFEGPMAGGETRRVEFAPVKAASGIYLVKLTTASGKSVTKRVVME